ncbi:MAG: 3-ketoacyl-ACP reductase, partial [Bryobacteraceae bacterium]
MVTGGSGGIGRAIVELLAREQSQVVSTWLYNEAPADPAHRAIRADVSNAA